MTPNNNNNTTTTTISNDDVDRSVHAKEEERGDEPKITIRCTVCSVELGVPSSSTNDDQHQQQIEEAVVPFVALGCMGKCRRRQAQAQHQATYYYYYCVPSCFEHFLKHTWGIYTGLGQAHQLFDRGLLGRSCIECRSDMTVVLLNDDTTEDVGLVMKGGSLSLEESLTRISPEILAKGLSIFQSTTMEKRRIIGEDVVAAGDDKNDNQNNNKTTISKKDQKAKKEENDDDEEGEAAAEETAATIRRLTQELEEIRILKCPSCGYKIGIPEDRGCDAAWCEHCGRALCLYCLTDCGDNPKTDPTAHSSSRLVGDAHDHVINNDCGLTAGAGVVHSGKTLTRYHEQNFIQKVALRLKRLPTPIRDVVLQNLVISKETFDEMTTILNNKNNNTSSSSEEGGGGGAVSSSSNKTNSLTELRKEMDNEKWEGWSQQVRIDFLHGAYKGDVPIVQCLLECGIPSMIPDAVGGETALHFAACRGHLHVVKILLEERWGANPWQLSPKGRTPLDDLCNMESSCDLQTARCLIKACMMRVPAIQHQAAAAGGGDEEKNLSARMYPWRRPWLNGTTALESAKQYHPNSPVSDYFKMLQEASYRLCHACAMGQTAEVEKLLSNNTTNFPRPDAEMPRLPPAQDLIWIYNQGSGCTPLLDLCAKSSEKGLEIQHVLSCALLILKVAKSMDKNNNNKHSSSSVQQLLQMRDCKFNGTALHWLALDQRLPILKLAGIFLQHSGKALSQAVDKRGQTPLDWARTYADNTGNPENLQKHIERWEGIILAWEGDMIL